MIRKNRNVKKKITTVLWKKALPNQWCKSLKGSILEGKALIDY